MLLILPKESADFVLMKPAWKCWIEELNSDAQPSPIHLNTFLLPRAQLREYVQYGRSFTLCHFFRCCQNKFCWLIFEWFPAIAIANDSVDGEVLKKPRRWDVKLIRNFMFTFGLLSSVFDYLTFAVLLIIFESSEGIFQVAGLYYQF